LTSAPSERIDKFVYAASLDNNLPGKTDLLPKKTDSIDKKNAQPASSDGGFLL
jgi:hypothetical protein